MAPDLNSVPLSPRKTSESPQSSTLTARRLPQQLLPGPARDMAAHSRNTPHVDNTGVGSGPGPLRHPRPLTAADLHLELEKEQEAVINRLTRKLSLLRQQSASATSSTTSTSSTSTGMADLTDINANQTLFGASHPIPSRRHRSSSSLSTRSINNATLGATSTSSMVSTREPAPASANARDVLSRKNSTASSRRSGRTSPAIGTLLLSHGELGTIARPPRQAATTQAAQYSTPTSMSPGNHARSPTRSSLISSARYDEVALHRSELEGVKRENEGLKQRIQELEARLAVGRRRSLVGRNPGTAPDASGAGMGEVTTQAPAGSPED